ncbi:magnesium transporter CorA family protein [Enterococcus asini]|uniref:magnesium transporter CorA family protein n=2 Tax=Enterococcus TaxID=1350 RepID=UPI002890D0BC|nr:magnesium transporter CorA family protein [Enterococcus asini]MDT2757655.1 magnesium transporter CorA family protein [Enterococcus asini]
MLSHYNITKEEGITPCDKEDGTWLVIQKASQKELDDIIESYHLPADIFISGDTAEEITHFERMGNGKLGKLSILSLMNLCADRTLPIEERLEPLIFVFAEDFTLTFIGDNSDFLEAFLEKYAKKITTSEKLCGYIIKLTYTHYLKELIEIKKDIDDLDQAARRTTENKELFRLADTQRTMVYLDQTLQGQKETLDYLWNETDFPDRLDDENLVYNIRLRQAHAEERIVIYRDLLDTIGGLFNDMMDNHLNHLMKYLDSAALVISFPALVSGIWGMNTGGLPGKESKIGFYLVMLLAIIVSIIVFLHLKRKDFSK